MAHPPSHPDTGDIAGSESELASASRRPRWVTVAGIVVVIALLMLFVVLHLTGAVGPGAH